MERFALPDLLRAMRDGERFEDSTIRVVEIGPLVLPTGRIVACDPSVFVGNDEPAYTRGVPPGRYPVRLSLLVNSGTSKEYETVACAAIHFTDVPVDRWEMALRPYWDERTLRPGQQFGYGVDAGQGCFADEQAVSFLAPDQERYRITVLTQVVDGGWVELVAIMPPPLRVLLTTDRDWANEPSHGGRVSTVDPDTGANIVAFNSGIGDGRYASCFGLAADGTVACLVTDFGLLIRHVDAKIELPVPVLRSSELRHPEFAAAGIDSICVEWASATNQLTLHLRGHADHLAEWHFENRPGQRLAYSSQGGTQWYSLTEPLQPTARVVIEYVVRTEAL